MSGHNKWSQIKNKKGAADQKRGVLFSKLLKAISIAARDETNPDFNPRLRTLVEKAKENNVPNENIDRAINKAAEAGNLEEVIIEAYGPEKSAFIILGITDNKNRTVSEVKHLLSKNGFKPAEQGSVLWSFEKKDGEWTPQFQQSISDTAKEKIREAISEVEEHADVQRVITNIQ